MLLRHFRQRRLLSTCSYVWPLRGPFRPVGYNLFAIISNCDPQTAPALVSDNSIGLMSRLCDVSCSFFGEFISFWHKNGSKFIASSRPSLPENPFSCCWSVRFKPREGGVCSLLRQDRCVWVRRATRCRLQGENIRGSHRGPRTHTTLSACPSPAVVPRPCPTPPRTVGVHA